MTSLSVVVPAHNEEATVESVVEEIVPVVQQLGKDYEMILVNDGSTDRTGEIGRTLAQRIPNFQLIEHFPNRHYGGALKAGFAKATKELIAFFPAEAARAHHPGPRATSRWQPSCKGIMNRPKDNSCELFLRHDPMLCLKKNGWPPTWSRGVE